MTNKSTRSPLTPNQSMLRRTLFLFTAFGIAAFAVLIAKLFQMQVIQHDFYEEKAINQQVRETSISASRGTIYDRNMKILAMSASVENIFISPVEINNFEEDKELIADGLSEILGVDREKILEKMERSKSWYETIAKKVERDVADQVRDFKNKHNLVGIKIEADTKRYYPYSSLASHVIGYVGDENKGLSGLEMTYNSILQGVNGRVVRAKDSRGTDMLFTKFEDYYDAENGNSVVLSLDSTIQHYLEKALENAVADYTLANGAAAIAMDVNTGGILGMASLNNFDLNAYQDVSEEIRELIEAEEDEEVRAGLLKEAQETQWLNKGLGMTYEPGSTFKIITLAMALEENLTGAGDNFYCGGSISVIGRNPGDPVKCWKTIGHGAQTLAQSVQHSCNVAFVTLGLRVGQEKFYEYAKNFGLFNKTGIELVEEMGLWWPDSDFKNPKNQSSLAAASFGQTFKITPLQLITAISACANGGYLMEPYIVQRVLDSDGRIVEEHEATVVRQVISEQTSKTVMSILETVVSDKKEGTGKNAYVAGYRIAGKTGTSTNTEKEALDGTKEYIVSFVGIAPADNPQIAILVLLDTPTNPQVYPSGGQMAAPTVGKIFADVLPYLGIEPQYNEEEIVRMDKTVPNCEGMTFEEAKARLGADGMTVRTIGEGTVVTAQIPHANAVIAADSEIILYLGAEPSADKVAVPDLTGLTYIQARQVLGQSALFMRTSGGSVLDYDTMQIASQSLEPGAMVEYGTVIEVSLVDNSMLGRY